MIYYLYIYIYILHRNLKFKYKITTFIPVIKYLYFINNINNILIF